MQPFEDRFSDNASGYARARPVYPPELASALARHAGNSSLAVDCGCGSGQLAVVLAERFDRVEAVDASAAQVAEARAHPRVRYRVARAEDTGLSDGCADLVCAAQAVHWFDLPRFWTEVDRLLRPAGVVALVGYGLLSIGDRSDPVIRRFHDRTLAPWWPPQRWQVVAGYEGIEWPFVEVEAGAPEMTARWSLSDLLDYLATWSAVRAAQRATGVSPLAALADELRDAWGDPACRRTVRWPLYLRVGHRR